MQRRQCGRPTIRLTIPSATRPRVIRANSSGGDSPPGSPVDMHSVKGILREYDRGAYGEAFRGDRLAKIAVLGKGSTSTVWKVVDVDTLRVVAVKEMLVCDSKQTAVLRHELRVLHPQLQPLIPPKATRGGRKSSSSCAPVGLCAPIAGGGNSDRGPRGARGGRGRGSSGCGGGGGGGVGAERTGPCPYMPRYFGSFVSQDDGGRPRVSIVLEHIPGVDLARWIEEAGGGRGRGGRGVPGPVPEAWLARVCRDMLEALRYLHDRRCIHRDVKPANLLLGPEGAKLADFGSTISEDEGEGHRMHGTIRFMSPERLWARQYRPSSDLWAAGLTVASAALGENPIPHCSTEFEAVVHAEAAFDMVAAHPAASGLSAGLLDFLKEVLVADPDKRPTVEKMLRHPFVLRAQGDARGGDAGGFGETEKRGDDGGGGDNGGSGAGRVGRTKRGGGRRDREGRSTGALEGKQVVRRQQHHRVASDEDGAEEAWSDDVRETLLRLRRKTIVSVDVADLLRRVLGARRSRWGHAAGSGVGLKDLDFSTLAAELALSSAELRSLFGSVAANMDGGRSGSWSSPANSSSASPAVTPISTSTTSTTTSDSVARASSPLRRSPLPRRRPPQLIVTPARSSAMPPFSAQTALTSPEAASSSQSLSPARGRSAGWPRGWSARNRRRGCSSGTTAPMPDSDGAGGVGGGAAGSGGATQGVAGMQKESAASAVGSGGIGWWKGWSHRRRFSLPRLFQTDKVGVGATIAVEPGTTELPSPRPDETPSVLSFNTPPLSRFGDEEVDGSTASARRDSSRNLPLVLDAVSAVGPSGPAAACLLRGEAAGAPGACDVPAPAWGTAGR